MKPVYLHRQDIDDDKWNRCIQHARFSCIYAYSWYLDAVVDHWSAFVIEDKEEYYTVMPLPFQYKYRFKVLFQPFYCHYLGIFSQSEIAIEDLEDFLQLLSKQFAYISCYNWHPALYPLLEKSLYFQKNFIVTTNYTDWLQLPSSPLPFTRDRIQNIKRAQKYHWEIEVSSDIKPLIQLFQQYHTATFPRGIHPRSYEWLEQLFDSLAYNNSATLWYAKKEKCIHAGILIAFKDGQHYYIFNAATTEGRRQNARSWLLNHYLTQINTQALLFDFESPQKKSIRQHYQSFGAEATPFYTIRKNGLPFLLKWIQEFRISTSQQATSI